MIRRNNREGQEYLVPWYLATLNRTASSPRSELHEGPPPCLFQSVIDRTQLALSIVFLCIATSHSFTKFAFPSSNSRQASSIVMSGYDYASRSFDPLPDEIRRGRISMGFFGLLSSVSTLSLLIFIIYRMIYWPRYYEEPIATNQIFVPIFNLLLADFQQALSFLMSF